MTNVDNIDQRETALINAVGKSLKLADHRHEYQDGVDPEVLLREIMDISRDVRNKVLICKNTGEKATLKVSVEFETDPMEIQLAMSIDTRPSLERIFERIFKSGINPENQILVLTPAGYRMADQETLETRRYHTIGQGGNRLIRPRIVEYTGRSSSVIDQFLKTFHAKLKTADGKK